MAKKTGYEQAAEADAKANGTEPTSGSPAAQGEPIRVKVVKKTPLKVADDLRAMNQIDSILAKFPPRVAHRILRYCQEKQDERNCCVTVAGPNTKDCDKRDARREPGGDLYTPPIPGMADPLMADRDHG